MGLRYRIELGNILRYIGDTRLDILDAGGGNGILAMELAEAGHRVTIVDYAKKMLANVGLKITGLSLQGEIALVQADLHEIPALFPSPCFDLVLCHNVIQYVPDTMEALSAVQAPLRDHGVLSLVTVNKYAEVYKVAFREGDLSRAQEQLEADATVATLFDHPINSYSDQDLRVVMQSLGYGAVSVFGVRCICDWLPNAPKYRSEYMAQLEALEIEMAQKFPYYLLARFYHLIGRKGLDPETA
jgi:S-adenosylmethionine-dependent methyltransferase